MDWDLRLNKMKTDSSPWGIGSPVESSFLQTDKIQILDFKSSKKSEYDSVSGGDGNNDLMILTFGLAQQYNSHIKKAKTILDLLARIGGILNIFLAIASILFGNMINHF